MKQHPSFEPKPTLLGIVGFVAVFAMTITAPVWMQSEQFRTAPMSESSLEPIASFSDQTAVTSSIQETQGISILAHSGARPFEQFCASCHGMPGLERVAGLTASDLFDGVSDRPMTRDSILTTLRQGILEKGMLPMTAVLSEDQLEHLVSFLLDAQPQMAVVQKT